MPNSPLPDVVLLEDDQVDFEAQELIDGQLETEEEEEDDDDDDDDESDEYEDDDDANDSTGAGSPRVEEEERDERRRVKADETYLFSGAEGAEVSQGSEWNRSEIDGLFCPICMEAWTNEGDHHICCLPCGHIYGMSCIKRWLQQRKNQGKCPHCNKKCTLKDVRRLFTSRVVTIDDESQKRIRSLEDKCASLEKKEVGRAKKEAEWKKREVEWKKKEAQLHLKVQQLTNRTTCLEDLLADLQSKTSVNTGLDFQEKSMIGQGFGSQLYEQGSCSFVLQKELRVDGARIFDINASYQALLIARSLHGMGAKSILTKMSLIPPHEMEDIFLPPMTNIIKDLRISPCNSSLALFASMGKKLSILSMESNTIVLAYDLPAAAWTSSWDINRSQYIYAGLQNGSVLEFDLRQTMGPVKNFRGLTSNPVHSLYSFVHNPLGTTTVLSASSAGLCQWNFGGMNEGPTLVPETENLGVCISLAYCSSSEDVVASYRPRVEMPNEMAFSQPSLSPSGVTGQGVVGSRVLFRKDGSYILQRMGSTYGIVDHIRLPRTTIIDVPRDDRRLFASADEVHRELVLQELPSFRVHQKVKSEKLPLRDIKYTGDLNQGLLGCLGDDTVQILTSKVS